MKNTFFVVALIFHFNIVLSAHAAGENCALNAPCKIDGADGGTYYLGPTNSVDGKPLNKLFVFFHGHNGSGAGVIRNNGLRRSLQKAGYILVAPDGPMFTFRGRTTRGWAARHEKGKPRGNRNDVRFVENMLEDIQSRLAVKGKDTVVSGFSSGGSMAWYFACYSRVALAGVVAVAGGLRRPLPIKGALKEDGSYSTACPGGPRRLVHIHGFTDRQVPLEGRGIRSWHQGDVFEGMAVQRNTNMCGSRPNSVESKGPFWCRTWTGCKSKMPLRFCLHAGGHGMPRGWLSQGLNWLNDVKFNRN